MKVEQTPVTGRENKESLSPNLRALSDFYDAFNNWDMEKMTLNWAQTEEAVMDNPVGGIKRGWEEIKPVYEQIFNSPARVRVEFYDYSLHQAEDIFYVIGRERGELKTGETVIDLAIRTSRIFKLINDEWKQIHHHGSIDDAELLARYQQAVKGKQ